ncbi:substrate-binding family protein [Sphingobacterium allocomposti]|uniref:Substrate-binding family protein n=1 Tax=Sphingobacterium allocomposti TaxID=415956 RepID=A0A5S5DR18_9SPHI|nr:GntR family transcriptional regulator [Sphingobacterium composti Yoo et al. 2007 non Ten et al. 2007]TYP98400.1 substrate-binding family protein [Sphingobacterium composti Yoo et al. 2007 non Ten et al. 2007]
METLIISSNARTVINAELIKSIAINDFSATPKYVQLADAIVGAIKNGIVQVGDPLPSINDLSYYLQIARDTVEKGYRKLRTEEIIASSPGKGYFVASVQSFRLRVAVFLNKLSAHKKIVYDAFAQEIGGEASIDLFVYNSDITQLRTLLQGLSKPYDHYVVFPYFKEGRDKAAEVLSVIPPDKLLLLGREIEGLKGDFPIVCENYEKDIYEALESIRDPLSKYGMLKLVFPDNSDYPKAIIKGFYKFCQDYAFDHVLVDNLRREHIKTGTCYINLAEDDLVHLLDKVRVKNLSVGQDVGVISYNETPLKKFILNGITTVSTDFKLMGEYAGACILNNLKSRLEVPFYTVLRASV